MNRRNLLLAVLAAAASWAGAGVNEDIAALIPKLSDADVGARYEPQLALQAIAMNAARPGAGAEREAVSALLAAKAADASVAQPARVWLLRQLELMGGAEAVPALTKALADGDAEIRETARRALERNPDASAGAVLLDALKKGGDTTWRIGLTRSLGQRRDPKAVELIAAGLKDAAIAPAAAQALAQIGDAAALAALQGAYDGKSPVLAQALVAAAGRAGAVPVLQKLLATGNPAPARAAALTELVAANPASAASLVPAAVRDPDRQVRRAAVALASRGGDAKLIAALAALVPQLPADAKAAVVGALDATAEPTVLAAAADADEVVRITAIGVLGRGATAAAIPVLLKAATSDSSDEKRAAEASLGRVDGAGVAAALEQAAGAGDAKLRAAALAALAARAQPGAMPVLLKAAADADATVSKAAFAGLRLTAGEGEIEALAKLALSVKGADPVNALKAAGARSANKAAVSKALLAIAATADPRGRVTLLDAVSATGGDEALKAALEAAGSSDGTLKDGGVRALANWCDWAAAPALLKIAADGSASETHQILAVRGVARLVQSCTNSPVPARAEAALAAMQVAKRDDEKKQLLSALGAAPDARALPVVRQMLGEGKYKSEAAFAAVGLAEALVKSDKAAAKELAKAAKTANISKDVNKRADDVLKAAK